VAATRWRLGARSDAEGGGAVAVLRRWVCAWGGAEGGGARAVASRRHTAARTGGTSRMGG
jgi:hypothetical protein